MTLAVTSRRTPGTRESLLLLSLSWTLMEHAAKRTKRVQCSKACSMIREWRMALFRIMALLCRVFPTSGEELRVFTIGTIIRKQEEIDWGMLKRLNNGTIDSNISTLAHFHLEKIGLLKKKLQAILNSNPKARIRIASACKNKVDDI